MKFLIQLKQSKNPLVKPIILKYKIKTKNSKKLIHVKNWKMMKLIYKIKTNLHNNKLINKKHKRNPKMQIQINNFKSLNQNKIWFKIIIRTKTKIKNNFYHKVYKIKKQIKLVKNLKIINNKKIEKSLN